MKQKKCDAVASPPHCTDSVALKSPKICFLFLFLWIFDQRDVYRCLQSVRADATNTRERLKTSIRPTKHRLLFRFSYQTQKVEMYLPGAEENIQNSISLKLTWED